MTHESSFHNELMETASIESIQKMQSLRLKAIVKHVYQSNGIYRHLFDQMGVGPEDIRTAEDVARLPLTNKDILRESYPLKMACVPRDQIVEMHMSSGSTGTPVVMPYTRADLDQWAECMARCYRMSGARPGDATQITPLFGLFNGGFGMYHGARAAGLFVIPAGPGNTARQIRLARDLKTRVFTGVVNYDPSDGGAGRREREPAGSRDRYLRGRGVFRFNEKEDLIRPEYRCLRYLRYD